MLRLPEASEKADHHSGKMAMANIYKATAMFAVVEEV